MARLHNRRIWTRKVVSTGSEYQLSDPFTGAYLAFPNALHRDNYLSYLAEPSVASFTPEAPEVSMLVGGRIKRTRFDAILQLHTGIVVLQEIKPMSRLSHTDDYGVGPAQIELQRLFTNAAGVRYELRTEKEIYINPLYIANKARMCQILTIHRTDLLKEESNYLERCFETSPSLDIRSLGPACRLARQRLEAAIYRLYSTGGVHLNLGEARYGESKSRAWRVAE